jgi:protein O-GlcNAc transferase
LSATNFAFALDAIWMKRSEDKLRRALANHRAGNFAAAERSYRNVLAGDPNDADAVHLLGMLLQETGREKEGLPLLLRAVELDPTAAHFQSNLGALLGRMGQQERAVKHLREALRLKPNYAEAWSNLGVALDQLGRVKEAMDAHDKAIALRPAFAESHHHRGNCLRKMRRLDDAIEAHRRALELKPDYPKPYHSLAAVYGEQGKPIEVIECHRRYATMRPRLASAGSDLVHVLHYDPGQSPRQLFEAAVAWAKAFAEPLTARGVLPHENDRNPDRVLRVGYVSPDFKDHPVARLMIPVLEHLNGSAFTSVCYSDTIKPDKMTERFVKLAGKWRETASLSDAVLAQLIRNDRIDILVDLAGHMGGNRLTMFALRPAPVQITHFNYPDITGMSAMDYRITDDLSEPPGTSEQFSTEQLLRLPYCAWCYHPGFDVPDVGPLPALTRGYVTFCSLNKPIKHSAPTVALWSKVLQAVPNSRLLLLGTDANPLNPALREPFAEHGITGDRLIFAPRLPRPKYLSLYNEVDIALDPFPYNGGVTSCDALWMGVPLVTLTGNTYHSRQGFMLLSNAGMPNLEAAGPEHYVRIAQSLALDLARLSNFRSQLRRKMATCLVGNSVIYTRGLEAAYRSAWAAWSSSERDDFRSMHGVPSRK